MASELEAETVGIEDVKVGGMVDSGKDSQEGVNGSAVMEQDLGQKENGDKEQDSAQPSEENSSAGRAEQDAPGQDSITRKETINGSEVSGGVKANGKATTGRPCWTIDREGEVEIRGEFGNRKPQTVLELVEDTCSRFPNDVALREEKDGKWITWTYTEYNQDIKTAAKAFIKLGLEQFSGVGIIGFNAPEWNISDLGAIFAGGLACGIYTTSTSDACLFIASDAKINILVTENDIQLQKFLNIWEQLPHLKAIIQYKGELKEKRSNVYTWNEFMEIGRQCDDTELKKRMEEQKLTNCCSLIYTSGTTGNPKGVMLSHDNVTFAAWTIVRSVGPYLDHKVTQCTVSYLPLSHIAAQMVDLFGPFCLHANVSFARPDALKGSLGNTLKSVRPTIFFGVPRVFEKIEERLKTIGQTMTGIKKKMGTWAKDVALRANVNKENGHAAPFGYTIASVLLKKIRVQLGLDRCSVIYTGAAPISLETMRYFQSINIPLLELYGMSECSGVATLSYPRSLRMASVGKVVEDVELKIFNQDADGSGEICMRGRYVFMGYLGNKEKTEETIDEEGWLHSGDIGRFDENGFLYITGRIKELIITAGGENIAPVPIEENIKAELPFVSNAMVIGDKKKFLSVLLTPKVVMDPDTGASTDELPPGAVQYLKQLGLEVKKANEIAPKVPEVLDQAIKGGISKANGSAVSNAAKVQKYHLLPLDFSIPGGELGPTLKLRRPQVHKKYCGEIDGLYEG